MSEKKLGMLIDLALCIGCNACVVACKYENGVPADKFNTWIESFDVERPDGRIARANVPKQCNHCEDAPCVRVCPTGASYKAEDGTVQVDPEKCIGCKMCANACPYDVPVFNTEGRTSYFGDKQPLVVRPAKPHTERTPGKAEHCTLCTHRTSQGRLPACVEVCSTKALQLVDYDNPTPETAKLIEAARPMNEAAGTHPKIRYIARHMDAAKMAVKLG